MSNRTLLDAFRRIADAAITLADWEQAEPWEWAKAWNFGQGWAAQVAAESVFGEDGHYVLADIETLRMSGVTQECEEISEIAAEFQLAIR
jgi:hypothetical protein